MLDKTIRNLEKYTSAEKREGIFNKATFIACMFTAFFSLGMKIRELLDIGRKFKKLCSSINFII